LSVKKILLVDDEFALADTLKEFLEQEGYLVEYAGNGREALEAMAKGRPDLVVSDMMMPLMDGKALLTAMRNDPSLNAIPVVLASAARRQIVLPANEELPKFSGFLRKPFQLDEFLTAVVDLVGPGGS
jgi:CheY-like chemotaxis protein